MKLKPTLLSAGACAGALLISIHAQTSGAGSGNASGATGATTATSGATGGATNGSTNAATNTGLGPLPGTLPSTTTDTTSSVTAGTQSDPGVVSSSSSTLVGAPPSGVPGANANATSGTRVVSPGTDPIGPTPSTRPSGVTSGPTNIIGGSVEIPRTPQSNPAFNQPDNVIPGGTTDVRARRDALGVPAAVAAPNPPPIAATETIPTAPGPNYQWVSGHYTLNNGQWAWVRGTWVVPPSAGAVWVDGRYDPATRRGTPGHWEPGASTSP